jgi:hypothetical protein
VRDRHSSDLRWPWQHVEWLSALTPPECLDRLTEIAGAARAGASATNISTVVVVFGKSVRVSFVPTRWWQGRPYFAGLLFRAAHGTKIIGRFNPDPFVFASLVLGLWCSVALFIGLTMLGWERSARLTYQVVETIPGIISCTLFLLAVGLVLVRSLHWRSQTSSLEAVIAHACDASRGSSKNIRQLD